MDELEVIDSITLPTTGYTTAVVDDLLGLVYIFQRDSYTSTVESYNYIVYDYLNDSIISQRKITAFAALQAVDYYDGRIIAINGSGTAEAPNNYRVFDTSGNIISSFVLPDFATNEPEGVFIERDYSGILVSFNNAKVYKITY